MIHLCYTPKVNLLSQVMAHVPKSIAELVKMLAKMPGFSERGAERFLEWWWQRQDDKKDFHLEWSDFLKITPCQKCFFFAYSDLCEFCQDSKRDQDKICVITSPFSAGLIDKDTGYNGLYFVLGGEVVNGRNSKAVEQVKKRAALLADRVDKEKIKELIIATDFTTRGEATALFIKELFKGIPVKISRLARGFQTGGLIDYGDAATLRNAFEKREPI